MIRKIIFFSLCISSVFAQKLSKRNANYEIEVQLNPENKTLTGKEILTWTNITNTATDELRFHLYLNAFKSKQSTFMKESGGRLRSDYSKENDNYGNIYLSSLRMVNGENLYSKIKFIQPDDFNISDQTVISVKLSKPVKPNETIQLALSFKALLPKVFARTGWSDDNFFMVGQWFPKIGVFEEKQNSKAQWNCHQFHGNTEFFSDFGTYSVDIILPKKFIVAACGSQYAEKNISSTLKKVSFIANDVHDFAWSASPHYKIFTKNSGGIEIRAFMQPEHQSQAERYLEAATNAISYCNQNIGKYPYKTLSIIDPTFSGSGAGGMEYPTLITCDTYWGVGKWAKFAEIVTIHEFSHQYFYGMLASNEFENSWMDEGFTQYNEGKIMDQYYPKGSAINVFGMNFNDLATSRFSYVSMKNPRISPIYNKAWLYPDNTYGVLSYFKTATMLKSLENLLGSKNMNLVFKTYFEKYKFTHPTAQNFIDVVNEIALKHTSYRDMNWFFDQTLFKALVCDYEVSSIKNAERKAAPWGKVKINRLGEMTFPTDVKITFADGKTQTIVWNGQETFKEFDFNKRVSEVNLDPLHKNLMDINLVNNSMAVNLPTKFAAKFATNFLFIVQQVFFTLFGLA